MTTAFFTATRRFHSSDGQTWQKYVDWAKIPGLVEVVSLDSVLCQRLISEFRGDDFRHMAPADLHLSYFCDLDYLMQRIPDVPRRNVLGLYRNSDRHIAAAPAPGDFVFVGYDLIEDLTQISALNNCGGFPDVFRNEELNRFGLIDSFDRAREVRRLLAERYPEEPHADCEMYAIWRLEEAEDTKRGR